MSRESLEQLSGGKKSSAAAAPSKSSGGKAKPSTAKVAIAIGLSLFAAVFVAYQFDLFGGSESIPENEKNSSTLTPEERNEYNRIIEEQKNQPLLEGGEAPPPPVGS